MFRKMVIGNSKEGTYLFRLTVAILAVFSAVVFLGIIAAYAETGAGVETQSIGDASIGDASIASLQGLLDKVIFPTVSGFVLSLLSILIHRISKKYKIDALVTHQDLIEKAALHGIALAEEQAAKYVSRKFDGNTKLMIAIDHVTDMVPNIDRNQAQRVIEGMLARIPGVGATKENVVAVQ